MAVLARHPGGGFEWLGFETDESPSLIAARAARRLERTGRLAAVVVLCPRRRTAVLSVSFEPRPLLTLDLECPSRLALHCLGRMPGAAVDGALGAAAHFAQAMDADAVGRRFFTEFHRILRLMAEALSSRMPSEDRHAVVLLQLTRVLFLYFVQAKGWLDRRPDFLREEVDRTLASREPLHRSLLRPLFFGTLNQPASKRRALARRFGDVPFLNGGLFEPHALERTWRVDLTDQVWREAFDRLFERFHFTTSEADLDAVAPDMLGRVFEGVMDPEERAVSGTFYTPGPLVHALVEAGIAAWLASRLACGDAEAERRLADPDRAARRELEGITILDPAAGSGAFLLGALEILAAAREEEPYTARARVLARNLYGVDRNPTAVRLTELRLWLALLQVDRSADPRRVQPLPNLDSMVRQGDSLVEPVLPGWNPAPAHPAALEVRRLRDRLHHACGREKGTALRALRKAETALLDGSLRAAEAAVVARIADLTAQGRSTTLFGGRRGLTPGEQRTLRGFRERRAFLWRLRRRLARDGTMPWFHFQSQFAEVFADGGGFDLVVGNPPWVRAEALPQALRDQLAARYRWWATGARGGYAHQPDLAVAFLERAHELAGPGGAVAFLVPAKLATAGYGATARAMLATRTTLRVLADLTEDPRAGFDATTYPMALVITKALAPAEHRVRQRLESNETGDLLQRRLSAEGGPWLLLPETLSRAIDRVRADHPTIGERLTCHLGVKTGLNAAYLDPTAPIEPEVLWWAIRGRDVAAFSADPACRIVWTHGPAGEPLRTLPPLARRWLEPHRPALEARRDYAGGPWWTLFRVRPAIQPHRIVWADLAPRLEAVALTGSRAERLVPLNTCYVAPVAEGEVAHAITAWLNCTWIRALAAAWADPASGGYRRFNARAIAGLPLPDAVLHEVTLAAAGRAGRAGTLVRSDLDDACNRFLGLTASERQALAAAVPADGRRRR